MAYIRLFVLVLAFEVLVTAVVGLGIYFGFSVFPYSQTQVSTVGVAAQTSGITATVPMYMPTLADLKIPYTLLQSGKLKWGITAFLVSGALIVLQSFVRGMYLGALKGWIQNRKMVPLIGCGRRYFRGMMAWSVFQVVTGGVAFLLAAAFFPLGLVLVVALLFFSLTPYILVLQDLSFNDALIKAQKAFRRYFKTLLPLTLLAIVGTLFMSLLRSIPQPFGYAVPLLAYTLIGTFLITELMSLLQNKLRADGEEVPHLPFGQIGTVRITAFISVLLVPVLVAAGVFAVSGRHLSALDFGGKKRITGISYLTNFSDVFYASEQRYTAYEWRIGEYRIAMRLPDLSGSRKPEELRGIADITWQVDEEVRTTTGINVKPITHKSRLMYRLIRERAEDGNYYYSSLNGSASILPGRERPREPLSVQMTASGDGTNIFVLQYPTSMDISQIFHVSKNGQYLHLGTSQMNPMNIHTYWFNQEQRTRDVFEFLASKNQANFMPTLNRAYMALAAAMQEGDGRKVVEILNMLRRGNVSVQAPDWDENAWTDFLRSRYQGASLQKTLEFMSKAGIQGGFTINELPEKSSDKTSTYRLEVSFPDGAFSIVYEESKEDGRLISINTTTFH